MSWIRRAVTRLTASDEDLAAEDLAVECASVGATPVVRCGLHERVCVAGEVRSLTLRPVAGVPALQAELFDGSGSVDLVWLGRRRITGIEVGRHLVAWGRIAVDTDGRRALFNPRYELRQARAALKD